jgi:hypothetical protein
LPVPGGDRRWDEPEAFPVDCRGTLAAGARARHRERFTDFAMARAYLDVFEAATR